MTTPHPTPDQLEELLGWVEANSKTIHTVHKIRRKLGDIINPPAPAVGSWWMSKTHDDYRRQVVAHVTDPDGTWLVLIDSDDCHAVVSTPGDHLSQFVPSERPDGSIHELATDV